MAEVTNDLIYEVLKTVQTGVVALQDDARDIKQRLTSVKLKIGLLHSDFANQSARMDRLDERLARVETRLGPVEGAQ